MFSTPQKRRFSNPFTQLCGDTPSASPSPDNKLGAATDELVFIEDESTSETMDEDRPITRDMFAEICEAAIEKWLADNVDAIHERIIANYALTPRKKVKSNNCNK